MKHNNKMIAIISSTLALYTIMLMVLGVFGSFVQSFVITYVVYVGRIALVIFGYFLAIFVPIRIFQALERNKEIKQDYLNEQRRQQAVQKQKVLEEEYYKQYLKRENDL